MTEVDGRGRALARLHPALQHHLLASLHWLGLWPLQRLCVEPVLDGEDVLVAAGPGIGRRAALFLPLVSRMLSEAWEGTSAWIVTRSGGSATRLAEHFDAVGEPVGRSAAAWPPEGADPDVLAVPLAELHAPPSSLRALLLEDAALLRDALPALGRTLAAPEPQRLAWCTPEDDADVLLRALSPPGRPGLVVRASS